MENKTVSGILDEIERRGLVDDFNRYAAVKAHLPLLIIVKQYYNVMPLRVLPRTAKAAHKQLELLSRLDDNSPFPSLSRRRKRLIRMYWAFVHAGIA